MGIISTLAGYLTNINKLLDQILPRSFDSETVEESKTKQVPDKPLFPIKINYDANLLKNSTATPCSTVNIAKFSKIENLDGSVGWKFDNSGSDTHESDDHASPFMTSTGSTVSGDEFIGNYSHQRNANLNTGGSISSNSDVDSNHSLEEELRNIPDLPNPEFFDIKVNDGHSPEDENSEDKDENSKEKKYVCTVCGADFRIRGYLTRHSKKHAVDKAYRCPFYNDHSDHKCHPSGGFSRRDTYKTHLKARHFKYPQGTKSHDRASTAGSCGLCNKRYESNEEWVENHIETGECEGLPEGYSIRIKNSRRKENSKNDANASSNDNSSPSLSVTTSSDSPSTNGSPVNDKIVLKQQMVIPETTGIKNPIHNQIHQSLFCYPEINDYNDEYSLDIEQSMAFKPVRTETNSYNYW